MNVVFAQRNSSVRLHKVQYFVKVILFWCDQFLVHSKDSYVTLGITTCHSTAVFTPSQAVERSWFFLNLFTNNWCFDVLIDVPNINVSFSVTWSENTWMCGTPLCIIDILLCAFKRHYWWYARFWHPELNSPVHWTWKQHVWHFTVLFRLANTRMNIHTGHWSIVTIKFALYKILLPQIALINAEVFRADIKSFLFTLCKV